ncbi:HAD-IC family P-type ATPase [Propionicicella superfundia]|uniref:HAD-IC family P-type ATPase n=1 Tax=Propionicicella superfundia TaxID=348582 RepID=UPI00040ED359|nr:HAD-IC family P-type ATPase [Propionicicella superfundia]
MPRLTGLTAEEVAERFADGRHNKLPPRSGRSVRDIVRANVFTRINALLAVLLVFVLSTGSWINAAFGLLIIVNSAVGIVQEVRAKRTLDSLAVVGEAKPRIRRAEGTADLPRDRLVLDDLVEIGPGDQIVVDGEVVEESYLEIDESLLTGESDPVAKDVGDMVQSGSFVVSGSGAYRATRVGAESYAARLAAEASRFTLVHSELRQGINQILRIITWLIVPVGLGIIWTQLAHHRDWRSAVLGMAGAIVPMVPEGLVLLTSVAFAIGVVRLGRRNCLVQELPAIEGLARVDVVCADKTGTLTAAGMDLADVRPVGATEEATLRAALANLYVADPTPNASLRAIGDSIGAPAVPWPVLARAPFTSARKWSGVTFAGQGDWVLGAPEVLAEGTPAATTATELAEQGLRVLLLGTSSLPMDDPAAPGAVAPQGLVVLAQRVRPDARDTLQFFADQGIRIMVISGDAAPSVAAVARSVGVAGSAVDARALPVEAGPGLGVAVEEHRVFGRVTPQQKRAMVSSLQEAGHTVAMTGDGVNDVLALKDADLGVAMGSGSAASRSVAQIVLLDDRFATLPHVVAEGRRVIGNIERVANLFLTKTIYSVLLALFVIAAQMQHPFQPIHVTITGWFTIGIPAFVLSLAPTAERARPGFVGRVLRLALPAGVIIAIAAMSTYLATSRLLAETAPRTSTAALASLIIAASWLLCVVARPLRPWKVALLVASVAMYVLIFTLPLAQRVFLLDTSHPQAMLIGTLVGVAAAVLIEVTWWVTGRVHGIRRRVWSRHDEEPAD